MTSLKLAFQNTRKSFRDFTIYFLTLTLGVSIFYVFNSIESQQAIMDLTSGQTTAMKSLGQIMATFSILISLILAFLIIYANRYLLKRRKQEFGIYMTLGMERGQISRILVFETIFIGLAALVVGGLLGLVLSQAMALLTAQLLGAGIASFRLVFSSAALLDTVFYFGLTFLVVMVFNVVMVRRQKLINLIYAARQNDKFKAPRLKISVLLFLVALACLAAAYYLVIDNGLLMLPVLIAAVALGLAGTFLFFFSLSGFFLKLIQQMRGLYFKNLNMFTLRQLSSKIHTTYASITLVCLMLFASIATLSSGMGLAQAVQTDLLKSLPYDASLTVNPVYDFDSDSYGPYPDGGVDIVAAAQQAGLDLDSFASSYAALRYYDGDLKSLAITDLNGAPIGDSELYYAKLSEYNQALALQAMAPLQLEDGQAAISSTTANSKWIDYAKPQLINRQLTVGGVELALKADNIFSHALETTANTNLNLVVVLPDHLLTQAPAKRDLLNIKYQGDPQAAETLALESLKNVGGWGLDNNLTTKVLEVERSSSNTTTITYLAVYLGVIFLIASATVLAITQLSEASDNARRYKLLHKIGADQRLISQAIFRQILIYFGAPLALALIHSAVGIAAASSVISSFADSDIMASSLVTALIIVAVYGGYFAVTYFGSQKLIKREYTRPDSEM